MSGMVDGISGQVLGYQTLPLAAVIVAIGLLGALALWTRPRAAWAWALGALGLACAGLAGSWVETGWTSTADLLLALVAGVGLVALLAQHPTPRGRPAVLLTLLGTFLGFCALWPEPAMRVWALGGVGPVLVAALIRFGAPRDGGWWIGVGLFGVGLAVLALRPLVESEAATLLGLIVVALFLPVFPLHGAFMVAVTRLPGTATAVFAVLLPVLGFSELLALAPTLPVPWRSALLAVAVLTAVFGSLKALVQLRMEGVVAYSQFVQMALLLWYVVAAHGREPVLTETALYLLVAVLLIWSGLHLAASQVRARFGSLSLEQVSGLARTMPRFATLVVLLVTGAMGLPLFALFAAHLEILIQALPHFFFGLALFMFVWLFASWYFPVLMHRLLFGRPREDLAYWDLRMGEATSLVTMLVLVVLWGLLATDLFMQDRDPVPDLAAHAGDGPEAMRPEVVPQ